MSKITIIAEKAKFPGNLADEYLHLKSKIADLKREEKVLQDRILATGKEVIEGNFGRVSVSEIEGREQVDYKAAAIANLSKRLLQRYTTRVDGHFRFNVRARRGDEDKAA